MGAAPISTALLTREDGPMVTGVASMSKFTAALERKKHIGVQILTTSRRKDCKAQIGGDAGLVSHDKLVAFDKETLSVTCWWDPR
jgi:hypothetical protein